MSKSEDKQKIIGLLESLDVDNFRLAFHLIESLDLDMEDYYQKIFKQIEYEFDRAYDYELLEPKEWIYYWFFIYKKVRISNVSKTTGRYELYFWIHHPNVRKQTING